jgi:predicted permease
LFARRLLPRGLAADVFDPACQDLHIEYLAARGTTSRVGQAALRIWYAVRLFSLVADCWRVWWIDALRFKPSRPLPEFHSRESIPMFLYHVRHALRLMVREPGFTLAALLTLALGVGANVAVFAVVEAVLLRPLPYPDAERLTIVKHRDQRTSLVKRDIAIGDYVDLVARQSSFESIGGYGADQAMLVGEGEPLRVSMLLASPGLLETLHTRAVLGRTLQADDARPNAAPVVILGYDLWQGRFGGDPAIVGRGIRIGPRERQVVGVVPAGFHFPLGAETDVIVPIPIPPTAPAARKSDWIYALARLKPQASLPDANLDLAAISAQMQREHPQSNQGSEYFALSLRDSIVGDTKPALRLLLAAVGLVLLIACANVANLMLARSLARRREMAVRMALGAGRAGLLTQLLAESLTLALAAGAVGVLVASSATRALVALVPASISTPGMTDVQLDARVLAFALAVSVGTALLFGLVAALSVRGEGGSGALVPSVRAGVTPGARRAASALVMAEVALAVVLLVGAGLVLRSFARLLAVDPGFRTDSVMTMAFAAPEDRYKEDDARRALFDRTLAALRALPMVREAGAAVVMPLTGNNWTEPFERADRPVPAGERPPDVGWQLASGGYFRALGIPLRTGRLFDARDAASQRPVVIVSEAIERRFFDGESAVGRLLKTGSGAAEIVGVVGNIRRADLREEPRADLYFSFEQTPSPQAFLFVKTTGDPVRAVSDLRAALRSTEPAMIVRQATTLSTIAANSMQVTEFALWMLGIFAAVAVALAAVGIYGVMAYVARQRTREIGTRVALGATPGHIVWLLMREGGAIAAAGTVVGLTVGLVATRSLSSILFGVTPSDPFTMGAAALVLSAAALAASYLPARRAARIDPARVLADQ